MKNLTIVVFQSALQVQKSPTMEISEMIGLLWSKFQTLPFTQYLTTKEVACLLKVEPQTVRKYTKQGKLKGHKYGHRVFFKLHELINVVKR